MKRVMLTILGISIVANIVWLQFIVHDLSTNQVKTTATVTYVGYCRRGSYCPTFEYRDYDNKPHTVISTEGYNWSNKALFGIKVGDKRTVWYEKSDPGASYVLYGAGPYSVWVLPFIAGLIISGILGIIHWRAKIQTCIARLRRLQLVR